MSKEIENRSNKTLNHITKADIDEYNNRLHFNGNKLREIIGNLHLITNAKEKVDMSNKLINEDNFQSAIKIISEGILLHDFVHSSTLYYLKAKCNLKLSNYSEALRDINFAINCNLLSTYDNNNLSEYFKVKARINESLGLIKEATIDKINSEFHIKLNNIRI
ncbi:MAG: hypothetical protein HQ541_00910 [Mariniphaga sp.]|nr:hypothetical protein [Mariniphaga sp.]